MYFIAEYDISSRGDIILSLEILEIVKNDILRELCQFILLIIKIVKYNFYYNFVI